MKILPLLNEMAAKQVCPKCGHGPISKTHRYVQGKGWKCLNAPAGPKLNTEADYNKLRADLEAVEQRVSTPGHPLYFAEFNVDEENVLEDGTVVRDSAEYWDKMYSAAAMAAGMRAEEYGMNINELLGYVVY